MKTAFVLLGFGAALAVAYPSSLSASETVTYTYDARGRLIKVERTGSVNDGVKTEYQIDKAGNRKKVKTAGTTLPATQ